jgi:hypothetical protein
MARLINRFKVHDELINMINEADKQLIFISPYIKLHEDYKAALIKKLKKHDLEITIIFGKNVEDKSKSLGIDDLEFFKQFPNIKIKYCERLHAKIYANDFTSLVTSMNLHRFSAEENIEVGIICKNTLLGGIFNVANAISSNLFGEDTLDAQVFDFMFKIIDQYSPRIYFHRSPAYEKGIISNTYIKSAIVVDSDSSHVKTSSKLEVGYCIRTGKSIPFNMKRPFSAEAFESWAKFKNENYAEKYCHFSGELSNGETCFKKPVLSKNWTKANH